MLRATAIDRHPGETIDRITLDHDARHRRRLRLSTDGGLEILLDLPQAVHLHHGDRLLLEDGRAILVQAAAEAVLDITAVPAELMRIAWHLGNRHTPTQLLDGALRIRDDHVLAEMIQGLGGRVQPALAPFDPETGAYAAGHGGHHHHHHD